jgi:RimJ/RimL family protein N-acetyltransferase
MSTSSVFESENLYFKPLEKKYLDTYCAWLNDLRINKFLGPITGSVFTREKVEEWYEEMKEQDEKRIFNLHLKGGPEEPIGYCGLYGINHRHSRGTIQVIIGEKNEQDKGYGTEATKTLLDFGFSVLGLRNISLSMMETNEKARRVPKKLGFREAGRLRDYWKVNGQFRDRLLMDISKEEFYEKNESSLHENYLT